MNGYSVLDSKHQSRILSKIFLFLLGIITYCHAFSQPVNGVQKINSYLDSLSGKLSREKIYIQTDRSFYNTGDTLWFKGYLFDAKLFTASPKSGILYVEILDSESRIARRILLRVYNGLFKGCIPLETDGLKAGPVVLRAYTNWMRNRSAEEFFTKTLYLNASLSAAPGGVKTQGVLPGNAFTGNNKTLSRAITAADIDLQFMPEGGHLVNGLTSIVGFKALNAAGKGVNVSGKIYNRHHQEVIRFSSIHAGMGSFQLTPVKGENYYAVMDVPSDQKKYILPRAETTGIVMQVAGADSGDKLRLSLTSSADIASDVTYYFAAQSRGVLCYGAQLSFDGGRVDAIIPKSKFKSGVVRLSLFDGRMRPVCERTVFVDHKDNLMISLKSKSTYLTQDSVSLLLKATNHLGEPVQGSFSLAVTDNDLTIPDSASDMRALLLLSADLSGTLEMPAFYFGNAAICNAALDALMLTQGWVNYKWNDFKLPDIRFKPQSDFTIAGQITGISNKGLGGLKVQLMSKRPFFFRDTVSDISGSFVFKNLPPVDTADFLLQALNKNGRRKIVNFIMPEDAPAPLPNITQLRSGLMNLPTDTALTVINQNNFTIKKAADEKLFGKNVLKEVTITARKVVKRSRNLNGPGNADDIVDDKEMLKAAKMPLVDFLYKRISGFHESMFPLRKDPLTYGDNRLSASSYTDKNLNIPKYSYMIKRHRVKFVFDGIDAELFFQPANEHENENERWLFLKSIIEQLKAEDIKGIEVMYSGRYNSIYNSKVSSAYEQAAFISPVNDVDYAYLEITTVAGKGPLINQNNGLYVYRPLMPSWTKEFYRPRYTPQKTGHPPDFRPTLHWESNVITNEKGEATVSFFSSDRSGSYTVIAEGSNMNGLMGSGKGTIIITER